MKYKSCLAVALGILVVVGGGGAWLIASSRHRISFDNYQKIEEGMTRQQIEALVGPPRWEVEAKEPMEARMRHWGSAPPGEAEWWGRGGVITVSYDAQGNALSKSFRELPFEAKPPSLWDYFCLRSS